jgi:hypothetical protein
VIWPLDEFTVNAAEARTCITSANCNVWISFTRRREKNPDSSKLKPMAFSPLDRKEKIDAMARGAALPC